MFVEFNLQSEIPLYMQLANQLLAGIVSGELKPGDPLPSVRSLAADLSINLHTVNKAYQVLKQDGFLQVHRKRGVVVHPEGMPGVTEAFRGKLAEQLRPLAVEAKVRAMNEEEFLEQCTKIYRQRNSMNGGEQHADLEGRE